jgi:hypothetical protein
MTHRMAACPLLIVVDEHVVPGEGAHVECVQGAEEPHHTNDSPYGSMSSAHCSG